MDNNNIFDNTSNVNQPNDVTPNEGVVTNNVAPTDAGMVEQPNTTVVNNNEVPNQPADNVPNNSEVVNPVPVINTGNESISQDTEAPKKKNNLVIIVAIAVAVVVALIIAVKLFAGGSSGGNSGEAGGVIKTVDQDQALRVKNKYTDMTVKVESVEKKYAHRGTLSLEDDIYTRIKITVTNNRNDKAVDLSVTNNFKLLDANGLALPEDVTCTTSMWGPVYGITDAIEDEVPAGSTISGYLYCEDATAAGAKLRIRSVTGIDEEALKSGQLVSTGAEEYYINLK